MFKQVIALGDSLTEMGSDPALAGWVAQMQNLCSRKADVLNRGFSGYNTRYIKMILPLLKIDWQHTIFVTILLGTNDAEIPVHEDSGNVPISEFTANLREIIQHVLTQGVPADRIILITPPPVDEDKWFEVYKRKIWSNDLAKIYNETVLAVAGETGTHVIPIYSKIMAMPNWKSFLSDGIHLSQEGNQLLFEEVSKILTPVFDKLPNCFPNWKDIDPQHPELIFEKNNLSNP
ncbi:Isoamyl acetate-hydrolyzing esterase 1-like [Oopsacas minuta]|uniref:Isoamyl acetate-hydrolyzing esterase 1-like n=1 Tax=Oopsacas minuta TaxID=111878 RepID=A0AAV7K068_9METZ|nr:Isoamyl acetate-hydrolyzing esterase 1-like [Oopsacas minuta]